MRKWRLAKSLEVLRAQINERWPNRRKDSDGTVGDPAHAARKSDHNPDRAGIVNALDITHDPENGADCAAITEALRESEDARIKYVIFAGRMFASYERESRAAWTWGPYHGSNLHTGHCHVSVHGEADSPEDWELPTG